MTDVTARKDEPSEVAGNSVPAAVTRPSSGKVVVYRSEGQRLFCEIPGSLAEIGRSVGASKQSIVWWKHGDKTPGEAFRTTIQQIHGIPARTWDQAPARQVDSLSELPASTRTPPANDGAKEATYDYMIGLCLEILESKELKAVDRLKAVAELGKLRDKKDRHERMVKKPVTDREIVRSAAWVRLREALGTALKPFPEALAAVVDVLKKMDV